MAQRRHKARYVVSESARCALPSDHHTKIQPAITAFSASEFCQQLALSENTVMRGWLKKLVPPQPSRCKTKTSCNLVTLVFLHLRLVTWIYFEMLLAPSDSYLGSDGCNSCDYLAFGFTMLNWKVP